MDLLELGANIVTVVGAVSPWIQKARKSFSWEKDESDGIVERSCLSSKKRLSGEVFAAEILSEPVRIEPKCNGQPLRIVIDRCNVEQAVITTKGKGVLCKNFVEPNLTDMIKLDKFLHEFLRRAISGAADPVILPPMPFRWASGGILSVVKIDGRRYVPMFFRDIPPAGWNIPLGSSERLIDEKGHVLSDFDHELNTPSQFILREFFEETLLLDRDPVLTEPKRYEFGMQFALSPEERRMMAEHQRKQRKLRSECDHMKITDDHDLKLWPKFLSLPMNLTIHDGRGDPHHLADVLVSINCLELGIEVVKVIEYDIPPGKQAYFLDGEILEKNLSLPELVRMPVALFPLDLLREHFSGEIELEYQEGSQASLEGPQGLSKQGVILFNWDIERRNAIADDSEKGVGSEHERYRKWREKFSGGFADDSIPSLFTPATVKILNMLFSVTRMQ